MEIYTGTNYYIKKEHSISPMQIELKDGSNLLSSLVNYANIAIPPLNAIYESICKDAPSRLGIYIEPYYDKEICTVRPLNARLIKLTHSIINNSIRSLEDALDANDYTKSENRIMINSYDNDIIYKFFIE